MHNLSDQSDRSRNTLLFWVCLLTFINIACFTIISSFTKSNFLDAIASSSYFTSIFNQKPYFLLYGLTGICFVVYSFIYYVYGSRISFERRIKREMLALLIASLVLFCIPQVLPGFHQQFLPAMSYFAIIDIFDELIIVQTGSLINYCINIRESKRYQYIFLLSGSLGALIAGYLVIERVPRGNELFFLLMAAALSACSYAIISFIFYNYRDRINISMSVAKERLRPLLLSRKKFRIIRSILLVVILIGVFNLIFKVLFDVQVNAYYANRGPSTAADFADADPVLSEPTVGSDTTADPKTRFIGQYKASISVVQVFLQLVFGYFFARLWLNGKILFAYPLLLIPNLLFILGVSIFRPMAHPSLIFWGTITVCAANDLLRRVIFDSSYQVLMFAIPEKLSNAIRMYSRLFFKPVAIISICAIFLIIPQIDNPMLVYTTLSIALLAAMVPIVSRVPGRYVVALQKSIQRRERLDIERNSLMDYKPNIILDQYKIVRDQYSDMFSYLYLLHLIRNSYADKLDEVLRNLLRHENSYVRFETVYVIRQVEARHLVRDLEQWCQLEDDDYVKEACLQLIALWGPANVRHMAYDVTAEVPIHLFQYHLAILYRWGSADQKANAEKRIRELLHAADNSKVRAGIWLVGELMLISYKDELRPHFTNRSDRMFDAMLESLAKMNDIDLFVAYLEEFGLDRIRNYAILNKHLARFGDRAFDVIFDMLIFMTRSRSFLDLEKCLRTLRFLPTQNAVDFLVDILFQFPNPHVKREALLCINRLRKTGENLNFDKLVERLPEEIDNCRDLCADYEVISATKPGSLLLLEMARKIETQVWMIFQILDLLHPELKVMDSFFRIKWYSSHKGSVGHTKAKSLEYLEAIMSDENKDILQLLESIRFDDGLFFGAVMTGVPLNKVEDVYDRIFQGQDYWLKLSAVWGMPRNLSRHYSPFLTEINAMMPLLEKFHLIKDSPLLKGLSMMELMTFARFMEIVEFGKSEYVFKIGDPADAIYKILEGKAELLDTQHRRIEILEDGIGIGFSFIIRKSIRNYSMRCIEDCRMLKISSDDFNEILELNPRIYKNLFEILLSMVDKDIYRF